MVIFSKCVWGKPHLCRYGGEKRHSHFCPILLILSNLPAFTSALEATTCGSTQPDLMKEPEGRHYNKAGQSRGTVWTQGPCLDAHDNQHGPTHLILLQRSDSIQSLRCTSSPAPHQHVFVDRCGGATCHHGELKASMCGGANKSAWAEPDVCLTRS